MTQTRHVPDGGLNGVRLKAAHIVGRGYKGNDAYDPDRG